jgi:hypothetical protein
MLIAVPDMGEPKRWNAGNKKFDDILTGSAQHLDISSEGRPWLIGLSDHSNIFEPKK